MLSELVSVLQDEKESRGDLCLLDLGGGRPGAEDYSGDS